MEHNTSRKTENNNSTRMQNDSLTIYSGPSDERGETHYNNELSWYQHQQGRNTHEEQGFGHDVNYQGSRSLNQLLQELEDTKRNFNEKIRNYDKELERKTEKIKQLEAEINDLLNRISTEAAARLTHNNPNITDLSDPWRPIKISERYSELYDNQWTDAYAMLMKNHDLSEPKAIEVLLDVLYISFATCKEVRSQRENLFKYLNEFVSASENGQDGAVLEVANILTTGRKRNIAKMQNHYSETVRKTLETKYKECLPCMRPYIEYCIEICHLMNIQYPPLELKGMVIPCSDKPPFDLNVFRPYTTSGSKIKYMVWPALYLYEEGPLMYKGIAQGM